MQSRSRITLALAGIGLAAAATAALPSVRSQLASTAAATETAAIEPTPQVVMVATALRKGGLRVRAQDHVGAPDVVADELAKRAVAHLVPVPGPLRLDFGRVIADSSPEDWGTKLFYGK